MPVISLSDIETAVLKHPQSSVLQRPLVEAFADDLHSIVTSLGCTKLWHLATYTPREVRVLLSDVPDNQKLNIRERLEGTLAGHGAAFREVSPYALREANNLYLRTVTATTVSQVGAYVDATLYWTRWDAMEAQRRLAHAFSTSVVFRSETLRLGPLSF